MKKLTLVFGLILLLFFANQAHAFVFINEILADPAGDANGDGIISTTQDEFIELLNASGNPVDLSGWTISDAVQTRHTFALGTLLSPYSFFVVFGGGNPSLPGVNWQKASTGTLSLNNTADTITFFDLNGQTVDQVIYGGIANHDQSIVRFPEGEKSEFVLHSGLADANGKPFSPGTTIDGKTKYGGVIPEPATIVLFSLGSGILAVGRRFLHRQSPIL